MRTSYWEMLGVALLLVSSQATADGPIFTTGLELADPARYQTIPLASAPLMGNLPAQVDMASDFPSPGDQGQQGSCVGWAVAYGLKSFHAHKRAGWSLVGDGRLFSPAYVFNQITNSSACQGSLFVDALNILTSQGAATLAAFPYNPLSTTQSHLDRLIRP